MLKLATFLDNPGEPLPKTRYRDPHRLRELGYNGLVLYKTTGLSGVPEPDAVGSGELRRWVQQQFDLIEQTISSATAAGLDVYICYDALSLASEIVNRNVSALTCKNRPNMLCPASEPALEKSGQALQALLARWPAVRGVILRFGDNDAHRLRYLIGNDIYQPHCPRCSGLGRVDRIVNVIDHFFDLVAEQLGKQLIVRAWNVRPNGMHDAVDLCDRLRDRLPGKEDDDRLILSFKFTQTDFWRYQKWNPASLRYGNRPIMYELQCQREFEGKGGVPNWQTPLWRDGYPEAKQPGEPSGLAEVAGKVNLAGLWAWVRGGGWGGPFVRNESWIDVNVAAVPQLADNPKADPAALAERWITDALGLDGREEVAAVKQVLADSPRVVLDAFYIGPYARTKGNPWHPNGDWIQDDLLDADAAWRIIQRLPESALDDCLREKQDAVHATAHGRSLLQKAVTKQNAPVLEPMINTLMYGESLYTSMHDLLMGLVAYRRFGKSHDDTSAQLCRQRLLAAQSHWNHHTQRTGALPGTASAFRESNFWELTQGILSEVG
jgi:hypothetical protein